MTMPPALGAAQAANLPPRSPLPIDPSQALADSILDAFPSGSYALSALLRLLDIVATDRVPTAAVECRAQPRLLINPAFVAEHAPTPEKLLMLVMHELHHVLLGHTTLFPRVTPTQNLVFDAVINGLVCRMFPEPACTGFFSDFYRDDRFPECLLRPPCGWPEAGFARSPGLQAVDPAWREHAAEIHQALYSEAGASYDEVYEILPRLLRHVTGDGVQQVRLLGGHEGDGSQHQDLDRASPLVFDLVRSLVEQWPQPPDPIRGRSMADVLQQQTAVPLRAQSPRATLRALIAKVAGQRGASRLRRSRVGTLAVQSPVPALSRRSAVLQALGVPSLLHAAEIPWRRPRHGGALVHIYLDVSGSMNQVLGPLYGAALDCQALLHPRIHLFSTRVVDITPAQLRAGVCKTTGGTSIDVVAEHMESHRVRRALIVTDGWVGTPTGSHRKTLLDAHLAVAYLGPQTHPSDLAGVTRHSALISTGDA